MRLFRLGPTHTIRARYHSFSLMPVDIHLKVQTYHNRFFKAGGGKASPKAGAAAEEYEDKLALTGAVHGKVVTRFPPEASGFLHIGHAKAALINGMLRDKYAGKMIFRFDDTNPEKENEDYEQAIIEDMGTLGVKWDIGVTRTSSYFDKMLEYADRMIAEGTAYVDHTPMMEMRDARREGIATPCRSHTVEENKRLWGEMKKASEEGQKCCMRAKISIDDANKALRDPTLYRVNLTPHVVTKDKYKVYPTYDFACPIVDSVEGVTHALRTNEYHDRNDQYYWIIDKLGIRKPIIEDFSRLNMEYTLMSKRKLTKLVNIGFVTGWDDPRFPTVRALQRRGLRMEALRDFVKIQGMSKAINFMEWSKLYNLNIQLLDPSVARYTAVSGETYVRCTVVGGPSAVEECSKPRHKKNDSLGNRPFYKANSVLLDKEDVLLVKEGEEVTLMDWGNAYVKNIKLADGNNSTCELHLHLDGDVKKTKYKLTWVAETPKNVQVEFHEFEHLLSQKKPDPDADDIESILNPVTHYVMKGIAEPAVAELKKGDSLQIERRGYYIVDSTSPVYTLFSIPDGRDKINHLSAKAAYNKAHGIGQAAKATKGGAEGMSLEEKKAAKKAAKEASAKASKKDSGAAAAAEATSMSQVNLLIGKVLEVSKHPESEKLYVEKIDCGEAEPRTILSGLQEHLTIEEFTGRSVVVVANLDPRKIGGIPSAGMVLCASANGKVKLLDVPAGVPPGERVVFPGHEAPPAPVLKKKLAKHWEAVAGELKTDANGVAHYGSLPFKTSKGVVAAKDVPNGSIS